MEKIGDINEAVGLDADLLGQEASPKNFQGTTAARLRVLAGEDDSTGRLLTRWSGSRI